VMIEYDPDIVDIGTIESAMEEEGYPVT